MKKLLVAALLAAVGTANAAWVQVWSERQGGVIYIENATMQFSGPVQAGTNPFIRAHMFTDYSSAINSDRVCYPSGSDCQYKRLNTMTTFDWSCNNVVRLVTATTEWDSGPTSQSWSRESYTAPAARQLVAAPPSVQSGGQFNISNDRSLLAVQANVCRYWPR